MISQAVEFRFRSRLPRLPKDGEPPLQSKLHSRLLKHISTSLGPGLDSGVVIHNPTTAQRAEDNNLSSGSVRLNKT